MEILSKLPFDLQEYIIVKIMKLYKLRDGKYIRQIDKSKYGFLDYIMRPPINKNSYNYFHRFDIRHNEEYFYSKFTIKNLYDNPLRKKSYVDDDILDVRIKYKNNAYHYKIGIYRLKIKNENDFNCNKENKDIYHKGALSDNYYWDFLEFSYVIY